MTTTSVSSRARDILDEVDSWDVTLGELRREGFSKVDSVRATVEVLGKSLAEAKALVHHSSAWADRRQQDEAFHAALEDTDAPPAREGGR